MVECVVKERGGLVRKLVEKVIMSCLAIALGGNAMSCALRTQKLQPAKYDYSDAAAYDKPWAQSPQNNDAGIAPQAETSVVKISIVIEKVPVP